MQPYKDHLPMGPAELVPEDSEEAKKRMEEMFEKGADEIKVFKPNNRQLNEMLSKKGMNRKQRRDWIKSHRKTP